MPVRRLIACHDATQLVTALAVLAARERGGAPPGEHTLLIHELWTDEERTLAATIRRLAAPAGPWRHIAFIDAATRATLGAGLRGRSLQRTLARVRELIGQDDVDELYLGREWQLGNRLLLAAYPGARRYCYGDGPGLYLPERYHDPTPPPRERLRRGLRAAAARVLATAGLALPPRVRFHAGWFLAPAALATPPMPTQRLSPGALLSVIHRLTDASSGSAGDDDTAFLLTSNFSDWRMERSEELRAYVDFVEHRRLGRDTLLLVKPHPREPREKSDELRRRLAVLHPRTRVLEEERFLPMELLYGGLLRSGYRRASPPVLTFGASGLSLSVLFGAPVHLGFGASAVRRHFRPEHREGRVRFERDLRRAGAHFRETAYGAVSGAASSGTMCSWEMQVGHPSLSSPPA